MLATKERFGPHGVLTEAEPMSQAEAEAGMRAKSAEFLAEGGKLYVEAAE